MKKEVKKRSEKRSEKEVKKRSEKRPMVDITEQERDRLQASVWEYRQSLLGKCNMYQADVQLKPDYTTHGCQSG